VDIVGQAGSTSSQAQFSKVSCGLGFFIVAGTMALLFWYVVMTSKYASTHPSVLQGVKHPWDGHGDDHGHDDHGAHH
jgi:hypothetical protein